MAELPPGLHVNLFNIARFVRNPLGVLDDCGAKFGQTFTLTIPKQGPVVMTFAPEAVQEIFAADPDTYDIHSPEFFARFLGPNALVAIGGDKHKRERKLMMPAFHGARMRAYGDVIQQIAWSHAEQWKQGDTVPARSIMHWISCEVILRTIFGVIEPERVKQFSEAVMAYTKSMLPTLVYFPPSRVSFFGLGPWARYKKLRAEVERLIDEQMERQKQHGGAPDSVLSMLLAARDDNDQPMSDEEIHDQMLLMLFAGQESTAETLSWAFYALGRHPEIYQRLIDELAPLGDTPDPKVLVTLPYLEAVCNETLRMYPVATNVGRLLKKPLVLQGRELPAGIGVAACIWLLHRNPAVYSDPNVFRPERWLERKYSHFEFIGFGGGTRRCIGAAFASYEMKIVLGTLLAKYRFNLAMDGEAKLVLKNFILGPDREISLRYEGPIARA